ncbi:MAG: ketoacyl-ACP synthase III [Desulfuromonadales bacterium]|nr:ketoacyl-ACP synthase III [Desulfuromonadales bacterium]
MRGRVVGTGSAVPEKILTNFDIEKLVDTNDEWIRTRTGIRERRIAGEGEYTSTFATIAAKKAMEMAEILASEIDLIIVATVTPDFPFPGTSCLVQDSINAVNATAFDISAACSGFIYGLSIADKYIKTGAIKNALVIGGEVLSKITDWSDRNTCALFGDGAGAVVLSAESGSRGILETFHKSDGSKWELLYQPAAGIRNPVTQKVIDERLMYINMQGNEVFKLAVKAMEEAAVKVLKASSMTIEDVDLFIPHQANLRIIDAVARRLGVPSEKVYINIDHYGNTSAGSIPIALDEANRKGIIKEGNNIILDAFGGGLTWGAVSICW